MKTTTCIIVLMMCCTACQRDKNGIRDAMYVKTGTLEVCGAYALSPLVQTWATAYQRTYPELKIKIHPCGSGSGITYLLQEKCDMAMVSGNIPDQAENDIWTFPVARMGVVLIINKANPLFATIMDKGIKRDDLALLLTGKANGTWGDLTGMALSTPVHVYLRSDSAGATDILARYFWCLPADLAGKEVGGETAMIDAIAKDPLALGYCNFVAAIDAGSGTFVPGIAVLPIDLNASGRLEAPEHFYDSVYTLQRAMWTGRFPCGLTRDLYLATKGKPGTFESIDFLRWVLKDGQDIVEKQGYIPLHSHQIRMSLEVLN